MHSTFLHFIQLNHDVKLVQHFPLLHFCSCIFWYPIFSPAFSGPAFFYPEIWSIIFQSCQSVCDFFAP